MKEYHNSIVLQGTIIKPGTPPSAMPSLPLVKDSAVSPQALILFRLLQRLSRRTGYACVNLLETLAGMFQRSLRATRYALAELLAAGWIDRSQTRKGGKSKLFFRPLVRVAARSRGLFSAPPVAGCSAGYSPSKLQFAPSAPYKTSPVGTKDDNRQRSAGDSPAACPVAVSILKEVCSDSEAQELAREASKQKLTEDQVRRVLAAYKGQLANIRNRGAWLRCAIKGSYAPAAPVSTHVSDQGGLPVARVVKIAKDAPFWTGQAPRQVPPVASPAPQPEQVAPGRGIGHLKATIEALKARTA